MIDRGPSAERLGWTGSQLDRACCLGRKEETIGTARRSFCLTVCMYRRIEKRNVVRTNDDDDDDDGGRRTRGGGFFEGGVARDRRFKGSGRLRVSPGPDSFQSPASLHFRNPKLPFQTPIILG